jgi:uncharacterized protein YjbI with pentapeptide repeats
MNTEILKSWRLSKKKWKWMLSGFVLIILVIPILGWPSIFPNWTGFPGDESISKTISTDENGNSVESITITPEAEKNLWDWLNLLGVPLVLVGLGYLFERQQRKRSEDESKEEALQVYLDRLSAILIDKNLLGIAAKVNASSKQSAVGKQFTLEERELLSTSKDVIRARTLSILRRFEQDTARKSSVIRFLIEADMIYKAKLDLSNANLKCADLQTVSLRNAYLYRADLSHANLSYSNLYRAYLCQADLSCSILHQVVLRYANLKEANLRHASLNKAKLSDANLCHADLSEANLSEASLRGSDLKGANLHKTNLSGAVLLATNLLNVKNLTQEQFEGDNAPLLCNVNFPGYIKGIDPNRDCKQMVQVYIDRYREPSKSAEQLVEENRKKVWN